MTDTNRMVLRGAGAMEAAIESGLQAWRKNFKPARPADLAAYRPLSGAFRILMPPFRRSGIQPLAAANAMARGVELHAALA